jgi:hypothetical protein
MTIIIEILIIIALAAIAYSQYLEQVERYNERKQ